MIKLAISGKAKSGKDTVARLIIDSLNLKEDQCKIAAFATPMKHIVQTMFPDINQEHLYGASEFRSELVDPDNPDLVDSEGNPLTIRRALTDTGAFGRLYSKNIWIWLLDYDLKKQLKDPNKCAFIVSDTRFVNEFNYLRDEGFFIIRVKRPDFTKINNVSETEQDLIPDSNFNYVINNDDTKEKLLMQVNDMVGMLHNK